MSPAKSPLPTTDALEHRAPVETSGPDWKTCSELVTKAYNAVSQPGLWPGLFTDVRAALDLPNGTGTLVLHDDGEVRYVDFQRPGLGLTHLNPTNAFGTGGLSRGSFVLAHLLDDGGRGIVLDDWEQLSHATRTEGRVSALEMFVHGNASWPASSREMARSLLPHLHGALRLHMTLSERQRKNSMLHTVVDRLCSELVLVDTEARVLYANQGAADRLAEADALRVHEGRLVARDRPATRELERSIRQRARSASRAPTCLQLDGRFEPVPLWLQWLAPGIVIIRIGGDAGPPCRASVLQKAFGLTSEDARVGFLFACGLPSAEIDERLSWRRGRARRRLAVVMKKTGARRQLELMRLFCDARPALR